MLTALIAIVMQLSPQQDAEYTRRVTTLQSIDDGMRLVLRNKKLLDSSPSRRSALARSMMQRFPHLRLQSKATVQDIYQALYALRVQNAAIIIPLVDAKLKHGGAEACVLVADTRRTRGEFENSGDFARMTPAEQANWKIYMDTSELEAACASSIGN